MFKSPTKATASSAYDAVKGLFIEGRYFEAEN